MSGKFAVVALCCVSLNAVILDRIAIVVGNYIIKDSDIEHNIRVTDFLNGDPLSFSEAARRSAARRLLDQRFIRSEIRNGDYPAASMKDAERQLQTLESQRFHSRVALQAALEKYGLTEPNLQTQFQ